MKNEEAKLKREIFIGICTGISAGVTVKALDIFIHLGWKGALGGVIVGIFMFYITWRLARYFVLRDS